VTNNRTTSQAVKTKGPTKTQKSGLPGVVLARIAVISVVSVFTVAPAPGNVGGCGGTAASQRVRRGTASFETEEYMYFDRGLCTHFCLRLRQCGQICRAVYGDEATNCDNDSPDVFARCVRGDLARKHVFATQCPHACTPYQYNGPTYEFDVQACGDAVLARTCDLGVTTIETDPTTGRTAEVYSANRGSIGNLFNELPGECLNVCR